MSPRTRTLVTAALAIVVVGALVAGAVKLNIDLLGTPESSGRVGNLSPVLDSTTDHASTAKAPANRSIGTTATAPPARTTATTPRPRAPVPSPAPVTTPTSSDDHGGDRPRPDDDRDEDHGSGSGDGDHDADDD